MKTLKCRGFDGARENRAALERLFPEAFREGNMDWDVLKRLLGETGEDGPEKFGLTWHGKAEARGAALQPATGTLRPKPGQSLDWETSRNLFIEGDNLEVLRLLQSGYAGKVRLIYIDPPFNTGREFIYPDNFRDGLKNYLALTGQTDADGARMTSNPETGGRYHTRWLNLMYPRLKLAHRLLRQDGVIFVSIGGEELANLVAMMDEIFGGECRKNIIVVRRGVKNVQAQFDTIDCLNHGHEYVVFYARNPDTRFPKLHIETDGDAVSVGGWNNHWRGTDRPTMRYELFGIRPESGQWRWGKARSEAAAANWRRLVAELGESAPQERIDAWVRRESARAGEKADLLRLSRRGKPEHYVPASPGKLASDLWIDLKPNGNRQLLRLMGKKYFDTPKSLDLIRRMLRFVCEGDDLVLDFFAGSCAAAHAVLDHNRETGDRLRFVMVQLPEPCAPKSDAFRDGFATIAHIGRDRIRRAAAHIRSEFPEYDGDLGFRAFRLDESNLKPWKPDPENLERSLQDQVNPWRADRSETDILFEILLKQGLELTVPVSSTPMAGKTVHQVGDGALIACLSPEIRREDVEPLAQGILALLGEADRDAPPRVVFRDGAFSDDVAKTRMTALLEAGGAEPRSAR
ncbi:MAG: site-specific DNA-methyltransferase [Desulfococcaceae bacterium]